MFFWTPGVPALIFPMQVSRYETGRIPCISRKARIRLGIQSVPEKANYLEQDAHAAPFPSLEQYRDFFVSMCQPLCFFCTLINRVNKDFDASLWFLATHFQIFGFQKIRIIIKFYIYIEKNKAFDKDLIS